MLITSLNFFIFLIITVLVYYILPVKIRWIALLAFSLSFFLLASISVAGYFAVGTVSVYLGARLISEKAKTEKGKKAVLIITIIINALLLFVLKYINIIPNTINAFGNLFHLNTHLGTIDLLAPIGISYYTLSMISYLVDVHWLTIPAEKNFAKLMLFSCYFPCLVSGPVIRYGDMRKEFFENGCLDWNNLFSGFYRIIYGLMKKMVIADNLAILVNAVFDGTNRYTGLFIIIGVVAYAMQIYCDFSGCMDIVIGTSRLYGVKLPENFRSPFFSRNLSEFWRRWHITLGQWGKDYIMYPLLKSDRFQRIGKKAKKRFGKKIGKKIPVILSIFVLWVIIGIWHGASYKYIFAAGILPWIYFSISELFSDHFKKWNKRLHIHTDSFSFHIFQSVRTMFLMCVIWLVALAPSLLESGSLIAGIFRNDFSVIKPFFTENVLMDHSMGAIAVKWGLILISFIGVAIVDYLKYKDVDVIERFGYQSWWFRYLILFFMIITTLMYGVYGPGYNAADFIYGGF